MKRLYIYLIIMLLNLFCQAQNNLNDEMYYRRPSLYSILINHTEQNEFATLIRGQFVNIPVPEKFNDHNLAVSVLTVDKKNAVNDTIAQDFVEKNHIASRMVAKWFNRDITTGKCNMDLIKHRGLYNATEFDKEVASKSVRGQAMLQDAGEDLINNTFLLINEVHYLDKSKISHVVGVSLTVLYAIAYLGATLAGSPPEKEPDLEGMYNLAATLKGFKVKIVTRLYQLEWNDDIANTFYSNYYSETPDAAKRQAFEQHRGDFKMKYIGKVTSKGNTTSYQGIKEEEPWMMVRKACQRAIDDNISDLQREYPIFRTRSPITEVSPVIKAPIGMKEGVEEGRQYEVLEAIEKNGKITYTRVGIVTPDPDMIWDNRFMAVEEGAEGADLGATSFMIVSGHGFYPGMLIREI
ncbi:MAG: hypothetical protein II817_03730 [Bacteroidales bacterium]|nr:hypothetical protein [Bacteroidales bacterium]